MKDYLNRSYGPGVPPAAFKPATTVWTGQVIDLHDKTRQWDIEGFKVVAMSVDWNDPGRNVLDRKVVVIVRRDA